MGRLRDRVLRPGRLGPLLILAGLPLLLGCCVPPQVPPGPEVPGFVPCELQPGPRFNTGLYGHVFEQITREVGGRPAYMSWPLFPVPSGSPPEELVRLGLPVHGRWATTRVNPTAATALERLLTTVDAGSRRPAELPEGSVIVKQNFSSRFQNDGSPALDEAFKTPVLRVLTVMYKPTAAEREEFGFACSTPALAPYNGDPASGCLGGGWFWAFYKLVVDNEVRTQPRACDNSNFGRWINTQVNENVGSFCVHCHSSAYPTDYSRIVWDNVARGPVEPVGSPVVTPAAAPACDATPRPDLPADVPANPLSVWVGPAGREGAKAMFDCFSWQTFVALNWPAGAKRGQPDTGRSIGDPGPRTWQTYLPVYALFQPGDLGWSAPSFEMPPIVDAPGCEAGEGQMVLTLGSKARDVVNETGQAFAGTFGNLVDRNTNEVRYEVLINETERDYVADNQFARTFRLTPNGPIDPDPEGPVLARVDFTDGSIEVKSAWKQLCTEPGCQPVDDPGDYYTTEGLIYDQASNSCGEPVEMGLIAIHLAIKTFWAPQWVWATFSNVHNAPLEGNQEQLASDDFSFYDPRRKPPPDALNCALAPFLLSPGGCRNVVVNRFGNRPGGLPPFLPPPNEPNQITRLVPPDRPADTVNAQFRAALAGTPFENYVLLDAQWPLNGQAGTPQAPKPVTRRCAETSGDEFRFGDNCFAIVPPVLRNPVVESYMTTYELEQSEPTQISNRGCLNCHFLGAQGSYIWLDATANQVPVAPVP